MALAELSLQDLRCIETAGLEFGPGINLIYGANGAGKTSLLEAAFLLGRGRSFRTRLNERLIRHGQPFARVVGKTFPAREPVAVSGLVPGVEDAARTGPAHTLGLEIRREGTEGGGTVARLDGGPVRSLADLATAFPVQALDPDAHKLIEESSARRRRWLDWAVFHVEQGFAGAWSRYQRALLQRNAALRAGSREIEAWEPDLAREGEVLTAARERVMVALQPYWAEVSADLVGVEITLGFQAGWDRSSSLADALTAATPRDRDRRSTTVGPHRADASLRVRGKAARDVLSRGQQKLAAVALSLCQLEYLKREHGLLPTLLLDDPSAELDQDRLGRFIGRVQALETQILVTALERDTRLFGTPDRVFHVEQGRVEGG
jgi:DNA replication and repair protein RecF